MSINSKIATLLLGLATAGHLYAQTPSVLSTGHWYKFSVSSPGVYKIDYAALKKAGFNPDNLDPRQVKVYSGGGGMLPQPNDAVQMGTLRELAILIQGESDGKFDKQDLILFYGQGPDDYHFDISHNLFSYQHNIYADKNYFFVTVSPAPGKRAATQSNLGTGHPVVDIFDDLGYYETEKYNILNSGRDWFGEQFNDNVAITVRFDLGGIVENSTIRLVSSVMAQAYASSSSFKISVNGNPVGEQVMDPIPNTQYALKGQLRRDTLLLNSNAVSASDRVSQDIQYEFVKASSGLSTGYLDYFIISMKRKLALYGDQTSFTASQSLVNPVSMFEVASLPEKAMIWDITDPLRPRNQSFTWDATQSTFSVVTDSLRGFIAFTTTKIPAATPESEVPNQNLSGMTSPDLLIVTHPDFKTEAMRLATHRQSNNQINVAVVITNDIYNEYSGGKQDVTAIRNFVRDLYTRSGAGLKNLLLFGRGSYDYKNRVLANTDFVPTYESRNSLSPLETYSSDDYFALLGPNEGAWSENPAENSSMDIGVGRLPVSNLQQAKDVVDKLIDYDVNENGLGAWRQKILFVADDGDFNIHQSQADQLATSIDQNHQEFITKKIYLDAFKQIGSGDIQTSPKARTAIDEGIESGAVIVNFTGHGSEDQWMQERVLDRDLIKGWKNAPKLPLFVTATCEFGRSDDPFQISSGERLLLQKKGGGIGLVTTARPVNSSTNFELNKAFYNALFLKSVGKYRDLGSVFRDTKNNSLSGVSNRNFSLIGDPSMTLAFPENEIIVNEIKTASGSDTLKGLSTVTIQGEVQRSGVKRADFDGEAEAALFDRPVASTTLGDENAPFNYLQWSNAIFRGKASVTNGDFKIVFVVPKNVESDIGLGKINVYAGNGIENAGGSSIVKVGGEETNFDEDTTPPQIDLFIGDKTFEPGGIASPNTWLLVHLEDTHGIAISGYDTSGGTASNDLVAILDDTAIFLLNEFYTAAKDDFTQGEVVLPIKGLKKGNHHVVVKASDTYSNRASQSIEFVVTDTGLLISEFYNYPNPFASLTTATKLGFIHNRPGEDLEAQLTIFDMMGQLVDTRRYSIPESFSHVTLDEWDGANSAGNKLVNGIYLGKLSVRSLLDGSKNDQFTKLIIVN